MASIADWKLQIKNLTEDIIGEWGFVAIVVLVGMTSFGLGRLSVLEDVRPPVSIGEAAAAAAPQGMASGGLIVASRTGGTYYFPWCSRAAKISPSQRIWFSSEREAQAAGYAPAKGCKGLTGN